MMNLNEGEVARKMGCQVNGIRPEHISLREDEGLWTGQVRHLERLGADTIVTQTSSPSARSSPASTADGCSTEGLCHAGSSGTEQRGGQPEVRRPCPLTLEVTHYVDLMPHNLLGPVCTAASVHLGAAVPNFSWLECRASPVEQLGFAPSFARRRSSSTSAAYVVPDAPGLGVEVDEDFLKLAEFVFIDPPMLRRDGSITD
ncbi:enolase C-terminal domain-like protein [Oceanicola granulosus]|uniref:enolase C-terminal domain-like protein n=1 Tax=Oceanicola granulosus TaxID=252302 RepID=UPI001FDF1C78|nr:enolase C-terminal domain-like protein [Oceanicola granulosus]